MKKIRISVDDGCASDIRLSELCRKYDIELIIYLPVEWHSLAYENGYKPLTYPEAVSLSKRHEIGSHTITHRHLTRIDQEEAIFEIAESQAMLRNLFKTKITKFAPPRGYSNDELTEVTLKFYEEQRLTRGSHLIHIHPNSGANNNIPWEAAALRARGPSPPFNDIELWCHSWELGKYNLWDDLEYYLKGFEA